MLVEIKIKLEAPDDATHHTDYGGARIEWFKLKEVSGIKYVFYFNEFTNQWIYYCEYANLKAKLIEIPQQPTGG